MSMAEELIIDVSVLDMCPPPLLLFAQVLCVCSSKNTHTHIHFGKQMQCLLKLLTCSLS